MSDERRKAGRTSGKKRRRKKRSRVPQIILAVCLFAAILLTGFLFSRILRSDGNAAVSDAGETSAWEAETAENVTNTPSPTPAMLTLTEEQLHTGDLILVNGTYPYDFAANESLLDLTNIREGQSFYYQVENTDFSVAGRMLPALDRMVAACDEAMGTNETGITSAYRSLEYQQNVWNTIAEQNGEEYANAYVASPGYSEHHTGLAVDVGIFYSDGSQGSFSASENAVWMDAHSCEFGFVRRYAEDKVQITGISNEAWHFRYVGIPHAVYMKQNNLCLEEYLDYLKTNTGADHPLEVSTDEGTYDIWYTTETSVLKPEGEYSVSGDNIGGYIITVKV